MSAAKQAKRDVRGECDARARSGRPGYDNIIAGHPAEALASARQPPAGLARAADDLPVLIVGAPRSGTTLVEQILSSHPAVAAGGELPFWQ